MNAIENKGLKNLDKEKKAIKYSDELVSLIIGLLQKERVYRLGNNKGAEDVLNHPFFNSIIAEN